MITVGISILLQLAQPQDPPVLGLVATPGHRPLADAEVLVRPVSRTQLLALQALSVAPESYRSRTDARGSFRLPGPSGPGILLVRHGDGLGALGAAFPGAAQRLIAEPMAAVVAASGPLRAWLQVNLPGIGVASLPPQEGEEIRLPAGTYQAWIEADGRLARHRLGLVPGKEQRLPAPPETERFVEVWRGFRGRVSPHGWPEVELVEIAPGRFAVPAGASRLQLRQEIPGGTAFAEIWHGTDPSVRLAEPPRRTVPVTVAAPGGQPLDGAEVWALGSTAQGVQPWCRVTTGRRGEARLVVPPARPIQLVAWHPEWPASTAALDPGAAEARLEMREAWLVRVRVEGPSGPGVAGARLELDTGAGPWARLVTYTDDRGLGQFDRAPAGAARVLLRDARFRPAEQQAESGEIRFLADPGAAIAGRAVLPSGRPARRALVTLRNPAGGALDERTVATDARGRFRFTGLDREVSLVLFAAVDSDGVTYSRKVSDVRAGEAERLLELRPEDPVPPHRRRGGRR